MIDSNPELTELNRTKLGLLSVGDLKETTDGMTENERKEYVSQVSIAYSLIKDEIETAIRLQVDHAIRSANSWEQVLIARGSINMGHVLLERFAALNTEHFDNIKPKETFDKFDTV